MKLAEAMTRTLPILFSGPMVRALLDGRKTETRRIVKATRTFHERAQLLAFRDGVATFGDSIPDDPVPITIKARWSAGDRLWVRETFAVLKGNGQRTVYRADGEEPSKDLIGKMKWTPSIFMRPSQSRLRLEVTSVRVERLHSISEDAARSEGVEPHTLETWSGYDPLTDSYPEFFAPPDPNEGIKNVRHHVRTTSARDRYAALWNQINGKTHPWATNPFVWVLAFRRAA